MNLPDPAVWWLVTLRAGAYLLSIAAVGFVTGWLLGLSRVARLAAAVLIGSGVLTAASYIGTWSRLVDTAYGRVLVLKLAAVAGVAALGAYNWRRQVVNAALAPAGYHG